MQKPFELSEAVAVYFEAKRLLFQDRPEFRLLNVGPLKCLHRHPGWSEADSFYALDVSPAGAVTAIREYQPDSRHMVTVFKRAAEAITEDYLSLGYETLPSVQPFMERLLSDQSAGRDQIDVQVRQTPTTTDYWIEADGQPVCWGRSLMTSMQTIYICGMETLPAYRHRGLASTVLSRIHSDAFANDAKRSILCSSPVGLSLYKAAGYVQLAEMQAFVPRK